MADKSQYAPSPSVAFATDILAPAKGGRRAGGGDEENLLIFRVFRGRFAVLSEHPYHSTAAERSTQGFLWASLANARRCRAPVNRSAVPSRAREHPVPGTSALCARTRMICRRCDACILFSAVDASLLMEVGAQLSQRSRGTGVQCARKEVACVFAYQRTSEQQYLPSTKPSNDRVRRRCYEMFGVYACTP